MSLTDTAQEKAAALLALTVSKSETVYAAPSDEELALLLAENAGQSGLLDATRKAQILDLIANDAEAFNRWVALVEAADTLGLEGFAADAKAATAATDGRAESTGESFIARFFTGLQNQWRGFSMAGGGLVAAAAVVVMVASPDYDASVDGLYGEYNSWSEKPARLTATRSLGKVDDRSWSPAESALYTGINDGLVQLGEEFSIGGLEAPAPEIEGEAISNKQQSALHAIGKTVALSYFKCSLGADPQYFDHAFEIIADASKGANQLSDTVIDTIDEKLVAETDSEEAVCSIASAVIDHIKA